jgi:hypothetical protein
MTHGSDCDGSKTPAITPLKLFIGLKHEVDKGAKKLHRRAFKQTWRSPRRVVSCGPECVLVRNARPLREGNVIKTRTRLECSDMSLIKLKQR